MSIDVIEAIDEISASVATHRMFSSDEIDAVDTTDAIECNWVQLIPLEVIQLNQIGQVLQGAVGQLLQTFPGWTGRCPLRHQCSLKALSTRIVGEKFLCWFLLL